MTKEHILSEIRRTAARNHGTPLGIDRFFTETGIKESDWYPKHWLRWSDALKEAGFPPNRWNMARADDDLLSRLGALVKELGRFPVSGELKMKTRSTPGFPHPKTLFNHFGGKKALAARLRTFFLDQGEDGSAALCAAVAESTNASEEPSSEAATHAEHGFVYLMKSGRYYKLGKTNAVGRRERELAIQLPEKPRLVHSIMTDDPAGAEAYWHRRFAHCRRGDSEWFGLTARDVAAFKRCKSMRWKFM
ncbi:MAG: GIY-YIG nuclease family protein [Candidatus Omnitrophota bacterium]|nr:GIY-YIG nuclease family protein [Candidatus Omnitrophota bacterium]